MEKQDQQQEHSGNSLRVRDIPYLLWLFTVSDFTTFILPCTAFGIFGALAGSSLTSQNHPDLKMTLLRLPLVVLFNWATTLIFCLANQRSPESVLEDLANKPGRPIPSGRITSDQTRRMLLISVPLVLALGFVLGVWEETALIFVLTWLCNDLKGGDEVIRDLIISVAYAFYNFGSLRIAVGIDTEITRQGYIWTGLISGVILTTMQIQDLKDQAGDKMRGRKSIPLFFGETFSRWWIAASVLFWSPVCVYFWGLHLFAYVVPIIMGGVVAAQVLWRRSPEDDANAWRLWSIWTTVLYFLPVVYCSTVSVIRS
ncbi:Fumagillin beta-trans-bergamotene synthase [Lachnellula suecica]|uniref:Fumagillin beta-trans-bergamotene synthase n=1 Tax=Lachnellula suecica TaxID=602035 RepID=A0A8T9CGI2_9HELO|nr:Fumagillin beta-trans-bergamotene synthase [Lachnellula suecica]